ncbi:amidase [Radicibacter daui]|uniref:amidase n=1 Tax=Radicibacter daui TaxID=3064829 RepID=UPI004046BA9C
MTGTETAVLDDNLGAFATRLELAPTASGPLDGLTFAAKDLFAVAGYITGAGNPRWKATHPPARETAPAIARLLAAGAGLAGMTHTDELAYSLMGENAHYGTPLNPAAPGRVPGGSSSGSASAVAGGAVDFALGTDTGGSVRLPASFCGILGLRPTHGRLPLAAAVPLAPSFDTCGVLARDIGVLTLAAQALGLGALPEEELPVSRLLVPEDLWGAAGPAVSDVLRPFLQKLGPLAGGLPLETITLAPQGLPAWREVFRIAQAAEAWQSHGGWISSTDPGLGPGVRERFEAASKLEAVAVVAATAERELIRGYLERLLSGGAVLCFPTAPGPAPLRGGDPAALDRYRANALALLCPAGLGGLPQISLPLGAVEGAPVGLSLVAAAGGDELLLALAARLLAA